MEAISLRSGGGSIVQFANSRDVESTMCSTLQAAGVYVCAGMDEGSVPLHAMQAPNHSVSRLITLGMLLQAADKGEGGSPEGPGTPQ